MLHHLVIGVIFLVWGIADVLRVQLPGVLARRLESSSEEARRLWQRLLGVLELIVGGGQLLFFFENGKAARVELKAYASR